jgi:hypothetical protein
VLERFEVRESVIDEGADVPVAERVLACAADAPHGDDCLLAQDAQLVRDGGLLHPDRVDDL